jgi:hypothetical protein
MRGSQTDPSRSGMQSKVTANEKCCSFQILDTDFSAERRCRVARTQRAAKKARIGVVVASGEQKPSSLDELLDRADIVNVARRLGLQLDRKRSRPQRALCPFHNDTTPSLNLFEARNGDIPHYHCFACGPDRSGARREGDKFHRRPALAC